MSYRRLEVGTVWQRGRDVRKLVELNGLQIRYVRNVSRQAGQHYARRMKVETWLRWARDAREVPT